MTHSLHGRSSNFESVPASAFGKLTTQGDFVRLRMGSPAASFVQNWIEDGYAQRLDVGAPSIDDVVHFVLAIPNSEALVVGAFAPSRDSVGREYPIVVFGEVPAGRHIAPELVPVAAQNFLGELGSLLSVAPGLAAADLDRAIATLPPVLGAMDEAIVTCEAAAGEQGIRDFIARCFVGVESNALEYAVDTTFRVAEMARADASGNRGVVLACPMAIDVDLFAWLALIAAASSGLRLSWVWTESAPSLLAALTAPTGRLLSFVGRTTARASALWPLTTPNVEARLDASLRLPPTLRATFASDVSLGDVISELARSAR